MLGVQQQRGGYRRGELSREVPHAAAHAYGVPLGSRGKVAARGEQLGEKPRLGARLGEVVGHVLHGAQVGDAHGELRGKGARQLLVRPAEGQPADLVDELDDGDHL